MSLTELLFNSLSPGITECNIIDQVIREGAEKALDHAAKDNLPLYLVLLCQELSNEERDPFVRTAAGLAIKNTMVAKDSYKRGILTQQWVSMDFNQKNEIKNMALKALGSKEHRAGTAAAQVIAAIAYIELPRREWPELIQILVQAVTDKNSSVNLSKAALECIGFICEEIDPVVLEYRSNEILTAVIDGMRRPESNIRQAAIGALYNSLEFIGRNFENEVERNYVMQVVCEATQARDDAVCVAAFECLVKIMQLFYDKMSAYMEKGLFLLTVGSMRHENEQIALQAVEFWSTVCETEIEIAYAEDETVPNFQFAQLALPEILPTLLFLLTKQEEDDDDDWNVSMAAGTCLVLLSQAVGDAIIGPQSVLMQFVEKNIVDADWHKREAAVMAFGSILEGPDLDLCSPYARQALPLFLNMMKDANIAVRDTTAWAIGRIVDLVYESIDSSQLPALVHAMCEALKEPPRVASNAAWCLMNLALQMGESEDDLENDITPYFQAIVTSLLQAAQRPDADANNLRAAAYQGLADVISHSAKNSKPLIKELGNLILDKLEETIKLESQIVGIEDRLRITDIQAHLCTITQNIIKKLGSEVKVSGDRIMSIFLKMFSSSIGKSTYIYEDVFLAVGSLIVAMERDFMRYNEAFMPILCKALQNHEEQQLISVAVGVVGDLCRSLSELMIPYCDTLMQLLLLCLQSPSIHRDVKPLVLSSFGDIAIAIGGEFSKYLEVTMAILEQAQGLQLSQNPDELDYIQQLRESILEAYTCIINGLKTDKKALILIPYVDKMISLVSMVYTDNQRTDILTRHAIGLLGDIAESMGVQVKQYFVHDWILSFIKNNQTGHHVSENTKSIAEWASSVLRHVQF